MKAFSSVLIPLLTLSLAAHEGMSNKRGDVDVRRNQAIVLLDGTRPTTIDWQAAEPRVALDEHSFGKMREDGIRINGLSDDSTFIRRLFLLLTGRLPEREKTRAFLEDGAANKREALIDEVLASEAFTTHWSFWFQEYFESTASQLRAGQKLYNDYFRDAVANGKRLDTMARELITANGLTDQVPEANFLVRAINNARLPQDYWDNAAIMTSTKFLGVPLECISCHDGAYHLENINLYLSEKKRTDLWGMAAFFSDYYIRAGTRGENVLLSFDVARNRLPGYQADTDSGDRPIRDGGTIAPLNMFTGEGAPRGTDQRLALADQIVSDRQFARNWANRLWGEMFGLAMVEPRDGFDLHRIDPDYPLPEGWEMQVLDPDLLEHMTDKMIAFGYDLRTYLRYVATSATFQMSPDYLPGEWQEKWLPYYARYPAHHMDAETVYDALVTATGVNNPLTQVYFGERSPFQSQYAHELIDINQPRGRGSADVATMLTVFGRGNRLDLPRTNEGSISQALVMMSSPVIDASISSRSSRITTYLDQELGIEQIIEELFLDVLCRKPTEEEVSEYLKELDGFADTRQQAESALWLLINRVDFTYIY